MNKKNKIIIAVCAVLLAVIVAVMGIVYHFYGPQTKLQKPAENVETALQTSSYDETEDALDETYKQDETSAEVTTEDKTEPQIETESQKETQKVPSKKPHSTEPQTKKPQPQKPAVKPTETQTETQKQETVITVEVILLDGKKNIHTIKTDANNLGDALVESGIAKGDKTQYGLFITTVDGITADSAKQQWWKLTKGGVMTPTGADTTLIKSGDKFELTLVEGYN